MKPHLPAYLIRHHAAQDAGHFTPYQETMKRHIQPIITNARRGLPVSAANTKRRNPWPYILGGCALFWGLVAVALLVR